MTEKKFKPYRYRESMIYYPENHAAIEGFAEMLYRYPLKLKLELHNKKILLGDTKYLMLLTDKKKVWLVTENRPKGTAKVWLKEQ